MGCKRLFLVIFLTFLLCDGTFADAPKNKKLKKRAAIEESNISINESDEEISDHKLHRLKKTNKLSKHKLPKHLKEKLGTVEKVFSATDERGLTTEIHHSIDEHGHVEVIVEHHEPKYQRTYAFLWFLGLALITILTTNDLVHSGVEYQLYTGYKCSVTSIFTLGYDEIFVGYESSATYQKAKMWESLYRALAPFANEITNVISLTTDLELYPHHAHNFVQNSLKTLIDCFALIGIAFNVAEYSAIRDRRTGIFKGILLLVFSFCIPNMFMEKFLTEHGKQHPTKSALNLLKGILIVYFLDVFVMTTWCLSVGDVHAWHHAHEHHDDHHYDDAHDNTTNSTTNSTTTEK